MAEGTKPEEFDFICQINSEAVSALSNKLQSSELDDCNFNNKLIWRNERFPECKLPTVERDSACDWGHQDLRDAEDRT